MRFKNFDEFGQAVRDLKLEYEKHFDTKFPERIIGWWDPFNLTLEEANEGYEAMKRDVYAAIETNTEIESIPIELWNQIVFQQEEKRTSHNN